MYAEELKKLDPLTNQEAHNLAFVLTTSEIQVKNEEWVDIILLNQHEEKLMLSNKINLLSFIKERTACKEINLNIKVKEYSHQPKLYEPREVYAFMKENNPHLADLLKVLGGEINY